MQRIVAKLRQTDRLLGYRPKIPSLFSSAKFAGMQNDEPIRDIRSETETCNSTIHFAAYWHFVAFRTVS